MSKKENAEDGSWYGGVPLWSLAESKVRFRFLQWVGSASEAGGIRPTITTITRKILPEEKLIK